MSVLPEPVGAWMRTSPPGGDRRPAELSAAASAAAKARSNQARVAGEKAASGSICPGYRPGARRTSVRLAAAEALRLEHSHVGLPLRLVEVVTGRRGADGQPDLAGRPGRSPVSSARSIRSTIVAASCFVGIAEENRELVAADSGGDVRRP